MGCTNESLNLEACKNNDSVQCPKCNKNVKMLFQSSVGSGAVAVLPQGKQYCAFLSHSEPDLNQNTA